MYEKQGHPGNSKQILTRALELASNNPYWSNRLLFQVLGKRSTHQFGPNRKTVFYNK
jgi:hypothetical protein